MSTPTPTPIRVRCTLDHVGPTVNGIRFGRVEHESGEVLHVSEAVEPERVAALLTIEGYERFDASQEAGAAIDEAIASQAMAEVAEAAGDSDAQRTITELQRANQAMAAELAEARAAGDPAALAAKARDVERLTEELATARAELETLQEQLTDPKAATRAQAEVSDLRTQLKQAQVESAAQGEQLEAATQRIAELESANAALAGSAGAPASGEAAEKAGGRRARG